MPRTDVVAAYMLAQRPVPGWVRPGQKQLTLLLYPMAKQIQELVVDQHSRGPAGGETHSV